MFSFVTPWRLRYQLSSSVSMETIIRTGSGIGFLSQAPVELGDGIQPAQPARPPAAPEDRDLLGDSLRRGPLSLVRIVAAQEIEAPEAALHAAANHRREQHLAD